MRDDEFEKRKKINKILKIQIFRQLFLLYKINCRRTLDQIELDSKEKRWSRSRAVERRAGRCISMNDTPVVDNLRTLLVTVPRV